MLSFSGSKSIFTAEFGMNSNTRDVIGKDMHMRIVRARGS